MILHSSTTKETISVASIRSLQGQRIALIKEYRRFTGMGLKSSKDAIELGERNGGIEGIINEFVKASTPHKVDIDLFKNLVCEAIDHFDAIWYPTMCEGLMALAKNLESHGGDSYLITHYDRFMKDLVG